MRAAALWLGLGLLVGLPFALLGVGRADASARSSSLGFRLLVLPASVLLWPWVLARLRAGRPARERNSHRDAAQARP